MNNPLIDPATLIEEQREAIISTFHEVRALNVCTNDLFVDDMALFKWLFGEELFKKGI